MESFATTTVGEIVAADFRCAQVFERFGIDFCCNGRRLFTEACRAAAADPAEVTCAIASLPVPAAPDEDAARWPVPALIDHIVSAHHGYVRSAMPAIAAHLARLADVHGAHHPELRRVLVHFDQLRADLEQHMRKEEHVLFPYVRDLAARNGACGMTRSPFGTVENPVRMMEREHAEAGDLMRLVRELTHGYAMPADGCATYAVTMAELREFERDLHRHVHLENNVLFPEAIRLERFAVGATS
jgi:regulator of cell morphogenesis and NO signaling